MDLIKKLTGKNPSEYEVVAKSLVENSDVELFAKLVNQDDFLFDFVKNNVAQRIQNACTKENFMNIINFFNHYSNSYDSMFAEVLYTFAREDLFETMKNLYYHGDNAQKAYAVKYFTYLSKELQKSILPDIRRTALSKYEPLAINSIELLSIMNDEISKSQAIEKLNSKDEFEQHSAVKFLVNYQAHDTLDKLIEVMKKSSFSENIASEIPFLIPLEEFLERDFEKAILVLCNIINAIPDIIPPNSIQSYDLENVFEIISQKKLTSTSAVLLRLAKDKFNEIAENDEYLYDCDKITKNAFFNIKKIIDKFDTRKLDSLLYDELYDESDFVFFAIDFVEEAEELRMLLDSKNQTLILKALTLLKEKQLLTENDKILALNNIQNENIKNIIAVL